MLSFISTQFLVLNLDGLFDECLTNLLLFDIPLLHSYTNLHSSIICCLSPADMYLFLGVALSTSTSVPTFGNPLVDLSVQLNISFL